LHANAVAKNRAARVRARGIDGDNSHLFSGAAIVRGKTIYQRALPRPGGARDADDVGTACRRENLSQQFFGVRIVVFNRSDSARDAADVSRENLTGPSVDA
jgi:hypothetical protein